ncbi:hypothetical protein BGP78_03500 [Pseudoalteromonas sp. MSK9-3]|uniref:hypothetical protein n=1 Tax=Pseudoalteromonas sp. MSK9-3 TaxID=1897633 RepID=UPI000E6B7E53|nr:hypothetical protein [Pseudoalteromonas sp. MSK9-3]RJE73338.1 hypothetical protein BGP78_03500 [Pseudoalteromonas sp. MSK9-3]
MNKLLCTSLFFSAHFTVNAADVDQADIHMSHKLTDTGKIYSVHLSQKQKNTTLYSADIDVQTNQVTVTVSQGHPAQIGKLIIDDEEVVAHSSNGKIAWRESRKPKDKMCLPALFGEFILAHLDPLKSGKTLTCYGPILKAKKLAPFNVALIKDTPDTLVFEIGPGSFGMWFFMGTVEVHLNKTATKMVYYKGITPAPQGLEGKMAYLEYEGKINNYNLLNHATHSILW